MSLDYFLHHSPNHLPEKKLLIDSINNLPRNSFKDVSHTDWNFPDSLNLNYKNIFYDKIYKIFREEFEEKVKHEITLMNVWFQCYDNMSLHTWHHHGRCHFSNVYYLNLPNKEIKTQLKKFGQPIDIDVSEGDILSFPAYYLHRSPINIFEEPKIIISFNTSLTE